MYVSVPPVAFCRASMATTSPLTDECTLQLIAPSAAAISCPKPTLSPTLTTGTAGRPMDMDVDRLATTGAGMSSMGRAAAVLRSGTCTPRPNHIPLVFFTYASLGRPEKQPCG